MPQYAIIHTTTRVIRRLTTDHPPQVSPDETAVDLAVPIDLSGGPWKLDGGNQKVTASIQEFRDAGMDETFNHQQRINRIVELRAALDDAKDDLVVPPKLRRIFTALRSLLG